MEIINTTFEHSRNLEEEIATLEKAMGIETAADRFLESCLLVDRHFVTGALLTDSPLPVERMFGDEEWASYLQTRLLTRDIDDSELGAVSLLLDELHACLMGEDAPEKGGLFRGLDGGYGGQFVDGKSVPLDLAEDQIRGIRQLGAVSFLSLSRSKGVSFLSAADPEHPYRGYIQYPVLADNREIKDNLFWIFSTCLEWTEGEDPYGEAAFLQQNFVILHPYIDMNGRLSRILMNWRLEKQGYPPSMLDDFDADVFSTPLQWRERVEAGCKRYEEMRSLIEAGVTEPIDLLGLRELKRFHDERYVPSTGIVKPIYEPGAFHSQPITKQYLADVERQAAQIP